MPVSKTVSIEELATLDYKISWSDPLDILIKDVLSSPNVFFSETSVQVSERLFLNVIVTNPDFIDVDFNWPIPHQYLGNYQLATWNGSYSCIAENEGFITSTTTIIEKRSAITICADPNLLSTIEGNIKIEQCNFQLKPELKLIPPDITPVVSYQLVQPEPAFEGFLQRQPPVLQSTKFQPQISEARVKLRPGCQLLSASYLIAPINNVFINEPAYILPVCNLPEDNSCQQEFDAFVLVNNSGLPIDTIGGGHIYSIFANCEEFKVAGPCPQGTCVQKTFTCSNGDTRTYWDSCG